MSGENESSAKLRESGTNEFVAFGISLKVSGTPVTEDPPNRLILEKKLLVRSNKTFPVLFGFQFHVSEPNSNRFLSYFYILSIL